MYKDMGQGFFERNIRGSLRDDEAPNRAINRSLRAIVLEGNEDPRVFAFNHNGVTLFAQQFESSSNASEITEPRLLNGAQTVTTFARFIDTNSDNLRMARRRAVLEEIYVPCRVITNATDAFVVAVTVSNNRQNPVMPWNLRANDMIQLELQEQFQFSLGIYYERQENAFANLSDANLEELGVDAQKAIELRRLAQTYLASDGEVDKMSRLPEVFENEKMYNQIFNESRLRADLRKVVLCYKIQFRLRRVIREILEKGEYKYAYIARGRNLVWALLCQALLNDPHTDRFAERFGRNMLLVADYTALLARLATTRVRFLIGKVAEEELYAGKIREERYDFLRSNAFHEKCMELAYKNWGWVQKRLK
jgi:hypothetical protein